MTISVTSICNRALQRLGAARILDITDDTRNGRSCNACYDAVRRSELRKHYWRFSLKRVTLAPLNETDPLGEFNYIFQLPPDYLRVVKPRDSFLDWQIEGGKLFTNQGNVLKLRYVADVTNPTLFDALFAESLAKQMANAMCEEITQSNTKQAQIMAEYKDLISEAKRINAFETIPADPQTDDWLIARR